MKRFCSGGRNPKKLICNDRSGGECVMKRHKSTEHGNGVRLSWAMATAVAMVLSVVVSASLAQNGAPRGGQNGPAAMANGTSAAGQGGGQSGPITLALNYGAPNYELAAKFMP